MFPNSFPIPANAKTQIFTSSGVFYPQTGASYYYVDVISAGAGGASGVSVSGAAGGCGGGRSFVVIPASQLKDQVNVIVGAGGSGVNNNATQNGGGNSAFGSFITVYGALGGSSNQKGGGLGYWNAGAGISPGFSGATTNASPTNQSNSCAEWGGAASAANAATGNSGSSMFGAGAGGSCGSSGAAFNAGSSGTTSIGGGGAASSGTGARAGSNGASGDLIKCGAGGGAAYSSDGGVAVGGNGGIPGGGGGAATSTTAANATSGSGARGEVRVYWW